MNGTLIRDAKDDPAFLAATAIDITNRMELQSALEQSEEKYRTVVESAGEIIVTVDEDGVFLFVNGTFAERFGGDFDAGR